MKLNINLTAKQTMAWDYFEDETTTECGYGGGARGGKSWVGCTYLMFKCVSCPDTRWLLGRKSLKNLKRTSLQTFFKTCKHHGLEPKKHFFFNQQDSIIKFWNSSEILLYDLAFQPSDPLYTFLGGLEITGALIEESNEIDFAAIDIIGTRVGNWNNARYGIKPIVIETFNPSNNHIKSRFWTPYKNDQLPKHRKFVRALVTDNPYVEPGYIDKLKQSPNKATRERLLYGNFDYDDSPLKLFNYDDIQRIFIRKLEKTNERYISADVAGMGKDETVICVWDGWQVIHIEKHDKASTDDNIKWIKALEKKFNVPRHHVVVDAVGLGTGVADGLQGCQRFVGNKPALGEDNNYKNIRTQCFFWLANQCTKAELGIICDDSEIKQKISDDLDVIEETNIGKDQKRQILSNEEITEKNRRSCDYGSALMMRSIFDLMPIDPSYKILKTEEKSFADTSEGEGELWKIDSPFIRKELRKGGNLFYCAWCDEIGDNKTLVVGYRSYEFSRRIYLREFSGNSFESLIRQAEEFRSEFFSNRELRIYGNPDLENLGYSDVIRKLVGKKVNVLNSFKENKLTGFKPSPAKAMIYKNHDAIKLEILRRELDSKREDNMPAILVLQDCEFLIETLFQKGLQYKSPPGLYFAESICYELLEVSFKGFTGNAYDSISNGIIR